LCDYLSLSHSGSNGYNLCLIDSRIVGTRSFGWGGRPLAILVFERRGGVLQY
jgi:hypothetical protein